jgi:hypothetical protein
MTTGGIDSLSAVDRAGNIFAGGAQAADALVLDEMPDHSVHAQTCTCGYLGFETT